MIRRRELTMDGRQSTTPWRCEVAWHAHTDEQRGPTCRPDSACHPDLQGADTSGTGGPDARNTTSRQTESVVST